MIRPIYHFLAGTMLGLLFAGGLVLFINKPKRYPVQLMPPPTARPFRVHVTGAVKTPGVYSLERGLIVSDAVRAAGGAKDTAALDRLNMAAPLSDGMQVYVPFFTIETPRPSAQEPLRSRDTSALIKINTASAPELEKLPGIGPSLAEAIITYRQEHGPFHSESDLLEVPGIGPAKLAQMKDMITFQP